MENKVISKEYVKKNYVSKKKIEEMIEERETMLLELCSDDNEGYIDTLAIDRIEYEIGVLEELLEEE